MSSHRPSEGPIEPAADHVSLGAQALLAAWFSPANPIGAFAYSHGLETLCADGSLVDARTAERAIEAAATVGGGRTDVILLAHAYRALSASAPPAVHDLCALGAALSPSAERRMETLNQGDAFAQVIDAAWPLPFALARDVLPHPVAVGLAGAGHGVPLRPLAFAYASGFVANLVFAAVRLVPLGQTDGQRIIARLSGPIGDMVTAALCLGLDDVGTGVIGLDLASMAHETQPVRLYRS